MYMNKTCSIQDCLRPVLAKELCGAHYQRQKMGKDLFLPIRDQSISDEKIIRGVDLVNQGYAWKEAAQTVGIDMTTLRNRSSTLGLSVRQGHQTLKRQSCLNLPTDPVRLSYIAAMLDAEGHISIEDGRHRSVLVGITNTNKLLLGLLLSIGGSLTWKKTLHLGTIPCATWQLRQRADCVHFLQTIVPYMLIKREKAYEAIARLEEWIGDSAYITMERYNAVTGETAEGYADVDLERYLSLVGTSPAS